MSQAIEAILFDMGHTLRGSVPVSPAVRLENIRQLTELIGVREPPQDFAELLAGRFRAYMYWAREMLIELDEPKLWTQWMLPDRPAGEIASRAIELNKLWRKATGIREVFPETKEVILELFRRGYRLGIISNTTSSTEIPRLLQELQLSGCFETVVLSCQVGMRKPGPGILLEAARRMEIEPARCAYVGDRLNRDVEASQKAGYARVVLRRDPETLVQQEKRFPHLVADYYIDNLKELLGIFPARPVNHSAERLYNASLSTMWARHNFPGLPDFKEASQRLGFSHIELNHQVNSKMLDAVDLETWEISSIHEPCPADISTDELKRRDWLMSSPEEDCRRRGVQAIYNSIDLGRRLSLPVVVVHCGMVSTDLTEEKQLRLLFETGRKDTEEYLSIKQGMLEKRAALIGPCFQSVKRSLQELLDYAAGSTVRLGLENRYHFYDIPNLEEMAELLAMADPARLGFVYDVGHAQALDRLGYIRHEDWLHRFSSRIIETHLHDVAGVEDHKAPGLGEIDYDMVARYLPGDCIRTLELHPSNSFENIKAGLKFLHQHGCINTIKEVTNAYRSEETTK